MSNKLKKKFDEERKAFKPYEGRKKRDKHIRLTNDMLSDQNFLSLSNTAKILYIFMKQWAYKNKDFHDTGIFEYSISLACSQCRVSNKTAITCFKELEKLGFIQRCNNSKFSRETSKWAFSSRWTE